MNRIFKEIIATGTRTSMPVLGRLAKAQSEMGEFAEAILLEQGHLPYKTLKEPAFGEAADSIICILDTLAANSPNLNSDEVLYLLETHLKLKHLKWKCIIDASLEKTFE